MNIYNSSNNLMRQEKDCTLKEFIQMGRLKPGLLIFLVNRKSLGDKFVHIDGETIVVGNCTPYIQPSEHDGGIGWDFNHPRMEKIVTEVHEFR